MHNLVFGNRLRYQNNKNKRKIDTLNFTKIKNFWAQKYTIKKMKRKPENGRKYLQIIYLTREYIKNYHNSTIKIITQFKNTQR